MDRNRAGVAPIGMTLGGVMVTTFDATLTIDGVARVASGFSVSVF